MRQFTTNIEAINEIKGDIIYYKTYNENLKVYLIDDMFSDNLSKESIKKILKEVEENALKISNLKTELKKYKLLA